MSRRADWYAGGPDALKARQVPSLDSGDDDTLRDFGHFVVLRAAGVIEYGYRKTGTQVQGLIGITLVFYKLDKIYPQIMQELKQREAAQTK